MKSLKSKKHKESITTTRDDGFTLIELLTTLTIIGIMLAVAIPHYQSYRARAYDLRAKIDLRSVATAQEIYFLDNDEYLNCQNNSCTELPGIARLSPGVELQVQVSDESFLAKAKHPRGTKEFYWDSEKGGMIE